MKSSASSGLRIVQSASLPGKRGALERALAARELPRLSRSLAGPRRRDCLLDDLARVGRVLLEKLGQPRVDGLLDETSHPGVPQLGLRLPLELRVAELHRDDCAKTFADVLALEVVLLFLEEALVSGVLVERPGQSRLEAREVRATLVGVDVVREGEHRLDVRGVPLHRHLDGALVVPALEVDDVAVHDIFRLVDEGHEVPDASLRIKLLRLLTLALVHEHDVEAFREKGGLPEALREHLRRELELLEDVRVREEGDRRPGVVLPRLPDLFDLRGRLSARELLPIDLAVAADLGDQPLR